MRIGPVLTFVAAACGSPRPVPLRVVERVVDAGSSARIEAGPSEAGGVSDEQGIAEFAAARGGLHAGPFRLADPKGPRWLFFVGGAVAHAAWTSTGHQFARVAWPLAVRVRDAITEGEKT